MKLLFLGEDYSHAETQRDHNRPVVIDLQEGISVCRRPYLANEVVAQSVRGWRKSVAPTAHPWLWYASDGLDDYAEALKQPVDAATPAHALPENWWTAYGIG